MKQFLLVIISLMCLSTSAQPSIKTITRPDGSIIKYFNPKPIIIQSQYEVGTAIYKNETTGKLMINISVLFKTLKAKDIKGKLTIQTQGKKGLVLKLLKSEQLDMNGNHLATALYEIDKQSLVELKKYQLKSIFFYLENKMFGSTVTQNNDILIKEINLYNYENILYIVSMLLLSNIGIAQTFNDLDAVKSKNKSQIEQFLKSHKYAFLSNQTSSYQWQSKDKNELIQFNGKGVLVFITYSNPIYKGLVADLKKSKYKYSGKTIKNNAAVESYAKGKETIFLTSMKNPENGKQTYSITFI